MKPMGAILIILTGLLIAAAVMLARWQPVSRNPFEPYAGWMPGQVMPREVDACTMYGRPYPAGLYVACHFDAGDFSAVSLAGDYEKVTGVYFFPREMQAGELMLWFGEPERTKRMGRSWIFYWRTLSAYTQRGVNRYEARVAMVWFREDK